MDRVNWHCEARGFVEPVDDRIEPMNSPSMDSDPLQSARSPWHAVWQRLGGSPPASAFERLLQAYTEPHRAYHTLVHILDGLAQLDWARPWAERDSEIEITLWFHDVVHDPHASDNEEQSAAWAGRVLEASHTTPDVVERVRGLILATRHTAPPASPDAALLVDVDLSILGRAEAEFARYDADIRREYHWVPEAAYRVARARARIVSQSPRAVLHRRLPATLRSTGPPQSGARPAPVA